MKDEPLRWGRLVLLYPCALSKILGFLWLRIIKNGIEKADIAAGLVSGALQFRSQLV